MASYTLFVLLARGTTSRLSARARVVEIPFSFRAMHSCVWLPTALPADCNADRFPTIAFLDFLRKDGRRLRRCVSVRDNGEGTKDIADTCAGAPTKAAIGAGSKRRVTAATISL